MAYIGSVDDGSCHFLVSSPITCLPCLFSAGEQLGLSSSVGCFLHRGNGTGNADDTNIISYIPLPLPVLAGAWNTHFTPKTQRQGEIKAQLLELELASSRCLVMKEDEKGADRA